MISGLLIKKPTSGEPRREWKVEEERGVEDGGGEGEDERMEEGRGG